MKKPLESKKIALKKGLIFGNGNTAYTMYLVLLDLGFDIVIVSRNQKNWNEFKQAEKKVFSDWD